VKELDYVFFKLVTVCQTANTFNYIKKISLHTSGVTSYL